MGKLATHEGTVSSPVPHPSVVRHPFPYSQLAAGLFCPHIWRKEGPEPIKEGMLEVAVSTQGNMVPFAHRQLATVQMVLHTHTHTHGTTGPVYSPLTGAGCNVLNREKIKRDFYVSYAFVKRQQLTLDWELKGCQQFMLLWQEAIGSQEACRSITQMRKVVRGRQCWRTESNIRPGTENDSDPSWASVTEARYVPVLPESQSEP